MVPSQEGGINGEVSLLTRLTTRDFAILETLLSWRLYYEGFPGVSSGKEPASQYRRCKRHRFNLWVRKIPWRRAWQPTPVYLPGESPWTEEPSRLQSIGLQRVRRGWSDLAAHTCWLPHLRRSLPLTTFSPLKFLKRELYKVLWKVWCLWLLPKR